jgi:hypothetical protein
MEEKSKFYMKIKELSVNNNSNTHPDLVLNIE